MSGTPARDAGARAEAILGAARALGGAARAFDQRRELAEAAAAIAAPGVHVGGMCHLLCLHWIARDAAGESLIDWLAPNGSLDGQRAGRIALETVQYKQRTSRKADFDAHFAADHGLQVAPLPGFPALAGRLERDVLSRRLLESTGLYQQLSLHGRTRAHALAVRVAQDARCFDPDYGEFRFPAHAAFVEWVNLLFERGGYLRRFTRYRARGYRAQPPRVAQAGRGE